MGLWRRWKWFCVYMAAEETFLDQTACCVSQRSCLELSCVQLPFTCVADSFTKCFHSVDKCAFLPFSAFSPSLATSSSKSRPRSLRHSFIPSTTIYWAGPGGEKGGESQGGRWSWWQGGNTGHSLQYAVLQHGVLSLEEAGMSGQNLGCEDSSPFLLVSADDACRADGAEALSLWSRGEVNWTPGQR